MSPFVLPVALIAIVYVAMVVLNERIGLFRDRFPSRGAKIAAYVWLGIFMILLCVVIVASSLSPPSAKDLARVPFYSLFSLHAILFAFLLGWWLLTKRPPIREFLNLQTERRGHAVLIGLAVGVGGWMFTIAMALMIAMILQALKVLPEQPEPSAMIAWMANLPLWKKGLIVLSAMTVEEAFFRGWLQKRVGLIASTILFALAHAGLGQPFLLIGVTLISLVIGYTFYRTKDLLPGIVAHGVFDAIQLFVIIPIAFRIAGVG
ncbi:MAG TPA: type II CAAX endopeptidase family protein [Thermoanaerobaculia bacterium]|nr:type II CAAX endopeptidase family protein [Thermoanaerobaculia bacterium]